MYIYVCVCVRVCVYAKSLQLCLTLRPYGLLLARLFCPWDSPGKNTGVGYYFLLQGIFLTQGLNSCLLCLLHWQTVFFFNTSATWEALSSHI